MMEDRKVTVNTTWGLHSKTLSRNLGNKNFHKSEVNQTQNWQKSLLTNKNKTKQKKKTLSMQMIIRFWHFAKN